MRLYLDSNVFISLAREEINGSFRLLFREAEDFFALCKKIRAVIVLSDPFFEEVEKSIGLEKEDVLEFFKDAQVKVEKIPCKDATERDARGIMHKFGIHFSDAVHLALAKKADCDLIITWNKRDFQKASAFMECKTPTEFIEGFY